MHRLALSTRSVALGSLVSVLALAVMGADAATGGNGSLATKHQVASEAKAAAGADEISQAAEQYAASRLAPGTNVSAAAFTSGYATSFAVPAGVSSSTTNPLSKTSDSKLSESP